MYKTYYIYIMSNTNDTTLYIGVTNDIERRVKEHRSGQIPGFTQKYNESGFERFIRGIYIRDFSTRPKPRSK